MTESEDLLGCYWKRKPKPLFGYKNTFPKVQTFRLCQHSALLCCAATPALMWPSLKSHWKKSSPASVPEICKGKGSTRQTHFRQVCSQRKGCTMPWHKTSPSAKHGGGSTVFLDLWRCQCSQLEGKVDSNKEKNRIPSMRTNVFLGCLGAVFGSS